MTTVELLVYCQAQGPQPYAPDLIWQRNMHRDANLAILCNDGSSTPESFHDMYMAIMEIRSWLLTIERSYETVLFMEDAGCSKPQK